MSKCDKLLIKATNSPHNLKFEELCKLAECFGWEPKPQDKTSHRLYMHPRLSMEQGRRMNFQNIKGQAKAYQVRQLLTAIDFLIPTNHE